MQRVNLPGEDPFALTPFLFSAIVPVLGLLRARLTIEARSLAILRAAEVAPQADAL